jgi:hypothetical protein
MAGKKAHVAQLDLYFPCSLGLFEYLGFKEEMRL